MYIFLDTEFTELTIRAKLLSIGLISENNKEFYAELVYDPKEINEWVTKNVIPHLNKPKITKESLKTQLEEYFSQFEKITIIADVIAWDWILFCDVFGSSLNLPHNIAYIPLDLATMLWNVGINPDQSRKELAHRLEQKEHNALEDARLIKLIFKNEIKKKTRRKKNAHEI